MKKIAPFQLLRITFFLLLSCHSSPPDLFDFENGDNKGAFLLKGEKVYFPEVMNPIKIGRKGSFLILTESSRISPDKPLIHLIDLKSLKYLKSMGVMGYGPGEISDAQSIQSGFNDSTFWVYSAMSKKMAEFSLFDKSPLAVNEFRLPTDMYAAIHVLFTKNNTFLSETVQGNTKLVEFNRDGIVLGKFGEFEKIESRPDIEDPFHLNRFNKGYFNSDVERGLYVKTSAYRDRVEIFDYQKEEFTILDGPRKGDPAFSIAGVGANSSLIFDADYPYGYNVASFGSEFIYLEYSGLNEAQIRATDTISKTVYVITPEGQIEARLDLDTSVRRIVVDEKLRKLYGVSTDKDPGIIVFDLPEGLFE